MSELTMKVRTDSKGGWKIEVPSSDLPPETEIEVRVCSPDPGTRYNLKVSQIELPDKPLDRKSVV